MKIEGQQREVIIVEVLKALDESHPSALNARLLHAPLKLSGLDDLEVRDVVSLLDDLQQKGWVSKQSNEGAPEVVRYKRTEEGRVYLRRNGF